MKLLLLATLLASVQIPVSAATILYTQDFENPTGFSNDGGDVNIYRSVNALYGGQPPGFSFAQRNTVETLLVGGTQAWGTGFLDPQGVADRYVLGMLSDRQSDLLGLSFNVGDFKFLNFQLDISSIDLDRWTGPFVPQGGLAPTFRFSLYDNPTGATSIASGNALSFVDVEGLLSPNRNTFNWSNQTIALDASGNTNGNVILQIDLLTGGYAAMDNFRIAASDTPGDVGTPTGGGGVTTTPEPSMLGILAVAVASFRATKRKYS
jgi:hypothetical protein